MAIGVIEPTGCTVCKGKVQLRFSFYLEPDDPRYNEHHVYVIDETSRKFLKGYKGKLDAEGHPVNQSNYDNWLVGLPHVWRDNPFNNHFVFIDANVTDDELGTLMKSYLTEFFEAWSAGKEMADYWNKKPNKPRFVVGDLSPSNLQACQMKVASIKAQAPQFECIVGRS